MAELPEGYRDIPDADRKKAQVFFDRGKTVADTGNYEYAIEMYIQGLSLDPESTDAHQALREVSLRRKASGGKPMGMKEKWALKKGDDKQAMLNAEKQLGYDPGNTDLMVQMMQGAQKAGCYDTVMWIGNILMRANADDRKEDFSKYVTLKDTYVAIGRYKLALDALAAAMRMRPDDQKLQGELKNLGARETISSGGYDTGGSFRHSIRDMEGQAKLMDSDKDVRSEEVLAAAVRESELAYEADSNDQGKLTKYIEALRRTEQPEYENRAIELLEKQYVQTKQFRFRQLVGSIKMTQLGRLERSLREQLSKGQDEDLVNQYKQFVRDRAEEELRIYSEVVENYPTDTTARYEVARRLFQLGRFDDAIPAFQDVRNDPKYRINASVSLGRAFLEAGFPDEAVDTLNAIISEYPSKGDERSVDMFYWYARALEQKGDTQLALKNYSQVFQWNAKFRDVQARIRRLRGAPKQPPSA